MEGPRVRQPWPGCDKQRPSSQRSALLGGDYTLVRVFSSAARLEHHADYPRNINSQRLAIPDVPVVYLLQPTAENINLITSDLSKNLYTPAYINFLSSVPRPLLEEFAAQTASSSTAENIAQVYDQYLNFIVSEPNLFSLGMGKDVYWAMNSAQTSDEELDARVDRIVSGLFSVAVTMGMYWTLETPKTVTNRLNRLNPNHPLSQRRSCRNDCCQARPQAARSYPQLQR